MLVELGRYAPRWNRGILASDATTSWRTYLGAKALGVTVAGWPACPKLLWPCNSWRSVRLVNGQGRRGHITLGVCTNALPRNDDSAGPVVGRRVRATLQLASRFLKAAHPGGLFLSFLQRLRPSLLDRWLLLEMLGPCVLAVAVFMTLGVSLGALVELVREVVVSGLPLRVALGAALLQMPRFLTLSLPFSSLAGSLLSMSRMQADSELVALASVGVSPLRLMRPALMLGVLTATLAFCCCEFVVPFASRRAQQLVQSALTTEMHAYSARACVTHRENYPKKVAANALQRLWYADRLQRGSMQGLSILEMSPTGELARIVVADTCDWNWDRRCWQLHDATILQVCPTGFPTHIAQLSELEVPMSNVATSHTSSASLDPSEMPRQAVRAHVRGLRQRLDQLHVTYTDASPAHEEGLPPRLFPPAPSGNIAGPATDSPGRQAEAAVAGVAWTGGQSSASANPHNGDGGTHIGSNSDRNSIRASGSDSSGSGKSGVATTNLATASTISSDRGEASVNVAVAGADADMASLSAALRTTLFSLASRDATVAVCVAYTLVGASTVTAVSTWGGGRKDQRVAASLVSLGVALGCNALGAAAAGAAATGAMHPVLAAWVPPVAAISSVVFLLRAGLRAQ